MCFVVRLFKTSPRCFWQFGKCDPSETNRLQYADGGVNKKIQIVDYDDVYRLSTVVR